MDEPSDKPPTRLHRRTLPPFTPQSTPRAPGEPRRRVSRPFFTPVGTGLRAVTPTSAPQVGHPPGSIAEAPEAESPAPTADAEAAASLSGLEQLAAALERELEGTAELPGSEGPHRLPDTETSAAEETVEPESNVGAVTPREHPPMIVDFAAVVGGTPASSFAESEKIVDEEHLETQSSTADVFGSIDAPGTPVASLPKVEGLFDGFASPDDLRLPDPGAFRQALEPSPPDRHEDRGSEGEDPETWDPIPSDGGLSQIVGAHIAAGGDAAVIAAAITRVAERVRRGEIILPPAAADGEAAALALALAALLQSGRQ